MTGQGDAPPGGGSGGSRGDSGGSGSGGGAENIRTRVGARLVNGRYRLLSELGRGGMGTVWRAEDELLGRQVALKELHLDDGGSPEEARQRRERTLREARSVAQVHHPNILVLHDAVEEDGRPWLVLELIDGSSLADRLAAHGPLEAREAARIGLDLLGALTAAHRSGVLHRDLKPDNVLLEAHTGRVVLTDFGIAQLPGHTTISATGAFFGTPEYAAPERISGHRAGPETDLWSLGVLLCAAVSGESPFRRDSLGGVVQAVMLDEIRPPAAAAPLLPVVRGLLEREPERRMGADAATGLLRAYRDEGVMPGAGVYAPTAVTEPRRDTTPAPTTAGPTTPAPTTPAPPTPAPQKPSARTRRIVLTALLTAVMAAAGAAAAIALLPDDDSPGKASGSDPHRATDAPASSPGSATPSPTPSPSTGSPSPSPSSTASESPDGNGPDGYHRVTDPAGFRMLVPDGFTRSYEPPRVFYYSSGKVFRIGVHVQVPPEGGPLAAMKASDQSGAKHYPGYRDSTVRNTTHDGHPAAIWEFTWDGYTTAEGARHTYDLAWEQDGQMYDVWVSAPVREGGAARDHYSKAVDSFEPGQ